MPSRGYTKRRMRGEVWTVAFSNDGTFMAAGSGGGDIALYRLKDGSEVRLPSSDEVKGHVYKVAFSEDSSMLLVLVRSPSSVLHTWKQIQHAVLPFDRISTWNGPNLRMMVRATTSHVATMHTTDRNMCVYDFASDSYYQVNRAEQDASGLLERIEGEYSALEMNGALFMVPFDKEIRYCRRTDSVVLGTLERSICQSFRPEQWSFNGDTKVLIAGSTWNDLLAAVLIDADETLNENDREAPELPLVLKSAAMIVSKNPGFRRRARYTVFISHAGRDNCLKQDVALPLYKLLMAKGIHTFLDKEELRPSDVGAEEMELAMRTADMGVFITSPEFACRDLAIREWTLRELCCFLDRRKNSKREGVPVILPVFYRLGVHKCRRNDLYETEDMGLLAVNEGFFRPSRQEEMPTVKALECLRGSASYTGVENGNGVVNDVDCTDRRTNNQILRGELIDKIVDAVLEAEGKLHADFEQAKEPKEWSGFVIT